MLQQIKLINYGLQHRVEWQNLGNINLIIGENSSGKTVILKAIYSALKTLEQYKKGNEVKGLAEILANKLYWTFQVERLGELVKKGEPSLQFSLQEGEHHFSYEFGKDTEHQISKIKNEYDKAREYTSIFIPAKEVLSLFQVILKSREQDSMFGFDDTYLDLVRALQIPAMKGKNFASFSKGRKQLEQIIHGHIMYDTQQNQWYFKRGHSKFSIGVTSEGIKKIAVFNRLLANHYLSNQSTICIDEVEAALHPKAISDYIDMIFELANSGVQFFIATHSYFVIKKLYILSKKYKMSVPVLSLQADSAPIYEDMLDGMPDNSIIDESIRLYQEEIDLALGDTI